MKINNIKNCLLAGVSCLLFATSCNVDPTFYSQVVPDTIIQTLMPFGHDLIVRLPIGAGG